MKLALALVLCGLIAGSTAYTASTCPTNIPEDRRVDCQPNMYSDEATCIARGCMYCESSYSGPPWCFYDYDRSGITLIPPGDLDHLPVEIADKLKAAALDCGWYTANQRYSWPVYESESLLHLDKCNNWFSDLSWFAVELISQGTMENIRQMVYYMSWYTANSKVGYWNDANNDMANVDMYRQYILDSGEMSEYLVDNIKWMSHSAGWYQQNVRWMYWPGADSDWESMSMHYDAILGDFVFKELIVNPDSEQIFTQETVYSQTQYLENYTDMPQKKTVKYTVVEGSTTSTSHSLGFGMGFELGLEIKIFFLKAGLSARFNIDGEVGWSNSMSSGIATSFEYPINVAPHSTYKGEAVITEGVGSIDYEIVFMVSGKTHSLKGTWQGTVVGGDRYVVCDTADLGCI